LANLLPIYYQVKQTIRNWIINREYNPGDKIPSENELADNFKVSRLTVRQAISQLIQEGFLVTKRGEGTFVTGDKKLINSFGLEFVGPLDGLFYQVSKPITKSAIIKKMAAPRLIKEKLELDKDDEEIVQIKRVRFLEKKPFSYTINFLPTRIGKAIEKRELYKKPLLQIIQQDLGIRLSEALQTIEASFSDQEVSEKLGVVSGSPILFTERIMYDQKRKPIVLSQSSYRGDSYQYIVRLKNIRGKEGSMWVHDTK